MARSVLVVAAHPDDEVLGCGGAMARYADEGATVNVAFLADGVSSREAAVIASPELDERREAARAACRILGAQEPSFGDFADNQMDTVALLDVAKAIEELIAKYQPDTLLTHHAGDVNIDHQRIHQATVVACRPQVGHPVRTLLFFEVPSSSEWQTPGSAPGFAPNWFVDITATEARKLEAMAAYRRELRAWPHPRSLRGIEALARWRGATIGTNAAEAFVLGRQLS
jgi:LmbE family N-acetylglucosaminyl deacetylase